MSSPQTAVDDDTSSIATAIQHQHHHHPKSRSQKSMINEKQKEALEFMQQLSVMHPPRMRNGSHAFTASSSSQSHRGRISSSSSTAATPVDPFATSELLQQHLFVRSTETRDGEGGGSTSDLWFRSDDSTDRRLNEIMKSTSDVTTATATTKMQQQHPPFPPPIHCGTANVFSSSAWTTTLQPSHIDVDYTAAFQSGESTATSRNDHADILLHSSTLWDNSFTAKPKCTPKAFGKTNNDSSLWNSSCSTITLPENNKEGASSIVINTQNRSPLVASASAAAAAAAAVPTGMEVLTAAVWAQQQQPQHIPPQLWTEDSKDSAVELLSHCAGGTASKPTLTTTTHSSNEPLGLWNHLNLKSHPHQPPNNPQTQPPSHLFSSNAWTKTLQPSHVDVDYTNLFPSTSTHSSRNSGGGDVNNASTKLEDNHHQSHRTDPTTTALIGAGKTVEDEEEVYSLVGKIANDARQISVRTTTTATTLPTTAVALQRIDQLEPSLRDAAAVPNCSIDSPPRSPEIVVQGGGGTEDATVRFRGLFPVSVNHAAWANQQVQVLPPLQGTLTATTTRGVTVESGALAEIPCSLPSVDLWSVPQHQQQQQQQQQQPTMTTHRGGEPPPRPSSSKRTRAGDKQDKRATVERNFISQEQVKNVDVLLGRGGRTNHHPGNFRYLQEKMKLQPRYLAATKDDKTTISQDLVNVIRATGGRFLKLDDTTGDRWYEVDNTTARKKASQTLREINTPEFRAAKRAKYSREKKQLK